VIRELVVLGAGPAGVSAALWARSLHLDVMLLEGSPEPGGQLLYVHFHPRELPGLVAGDGRAIAATYATQLAEAGIPVRYGCMANALFPGGERVALTLTNGERVESHALLIACGARRRKLDVPGEAALAGHGLSYSATRDMAVLAGRRVVVVGGGDAAYENALMLAAAGCEVTLVVRGAPRARREFRDRVADEPRIRVELDLTVTAVLGEDSVRGVAVSSPAGAREIACEAIMVKVGVVPNTEWCRGALDHDAAGYLRVSGSFETSAPMVWAAGDIVRPALASVSVAAGQGALAVAAIRSRLKGQ
jgi:thioredoxin reductase (NADPH)